MLELIITYLQLTFRNSLPEVIDVMGLAEIIERNGTSFPALYCTKDNYKELSDSENYLYFRQTGPFTESESDEEAVSGCDHYVTRTYPMVAVGYIPKNIYNTDNAFIDSKIGNNIANIIRVAGYNTLRSTLKVDEIYTEINSVNTNRYQVWSQENAGIDMPARFDHVLLSVEFDLIISATESCLRNFDCNDSDISVDGDTININIRCECDTAKSKTFLNITTSLHWPELIGKTEEQVFAFQAGTEQFTINNATIDSLTGTITFAGDLGGSTVKVQIFP